MPLYYTIVAFARGEIWPNMWLEGPWRASEGQETTAIKFKWKGRQWWQSVDSSISKEEWLPLLYPELVCSTTTQWDERRNSFRLWRHHSSCTLETLEFHDFLMCELYWKQSGLRFKRLDQKILNTACRRPEFEGFETKLESILITSQHVWRTQEKKVMPAKELRNARIFLK